MRAKWTDHCAPATYPPPRPTDSSGEKIEQIESRTERAPVFTQTTLFWEHKDKKAPKCHLQQFGY